MLKIFTQVLFCFKLPNYFSINQLQCIECLKINSMTQTLKHNFIHFDIMKYVYKISYQSINVH